MVLGHKINLVIHHYHSLFSNPHAHSPICVCQLGQVVSLPSTIVRNSVTPPQSEQATSDHQEGAQLDWVVVTFIGVLGWAPHQINKGGTITNLRKEIHHPVPLSQGNTEFRVIVMQQALRSSKLPWAGLQ